MAEEESTPTDGSCQKCKHPIDDHRQSDKKNDDHYYMPCIWCEKHGGECAK